MTLLANEQPSLDIQEVPSHFQQGVSLIAPVPGTAQQDPRRLEKLGEAGSWKGSPCGLSQAISVFV